MHPKDRSKLHTLWQTGHSPSMPVTPQHHGRSQQDQGVGPAPLQLWMSVVSSVPTEHDVPSGCEHLPGAVHTHTGDVWAHTCHLACWRKVCFLVELSPAPALVCSDAS